MAYLRPQGWEVPLVNGMLTLDLALAKPIPRADADRLVGRIEARVGAIPEAHLER
jgi:hypothetical protein